MEMPYMQLIWQSDCRMYRRECPIIVWTNRRRSMPELLTFLTHALNCNQAKAKKTLHHLNSFMSQQQQDNVSALNLAADRGKGSVIKAILSLVDPQKKPDLISVWFHSHCCFGRQDYQPMRKTVKLLLEALSIEQRIEFFLSNSSPFAYSPDKLMNAVAELWRQRDIVHVMLDSLENEANKIKILSSRNYHGFTPLDVAVESQNEAEFEVILDSLSGERLHELLLISESESYSLLLQAAIADCHIGLAAGTRIEMIKTLLDPEQWLTSLAGSLRAARLLSTQYCECGLGCRTEAIRYLQNEKTKMKISAAVNTTDEKSRSTITNLYFFFLLQKNQI